MSVRRKCFAKTYNSNLLVGKNKYITMDLKSQDPSRDLDNEEMTPAG